jgi:phosphoribosylanthranilate isomerase
MRDPANIQAVVALQPDYLGFIFYRGSKRFVANLSESAMDAIPAGIYKTGVFVNASLEDIAAAVTKYSLSALQLHGTEDPVFAEAIKIAFPDIEVIKAFGIHKSFDFTQLNAFETVVDYFLFDTQTVAHGGSGKQFDWTLLDDYTLNLPYFLSGGIGLESLQAIQEINDPRLYAIDINSKFEIAPAFKDVAKLTEFKHELFSGVQPKGK